MGVAVGEKPCMTNEKNREITIEVFLVATSASIIGEDNDVDAYERVPTDSVETASKHGHAP